MINPMRKLRISKFPEGLCLLLFILRGFITVYQNEHWVKRKAGFIFIFFSPHRFTPQTECLQVIYFAFFYSINLKWDIVK